MYTHTFYRSYCIIIIAGIIGIAGITNETHIFTVQGVYIFRKRVMCLQSRLIHIFYSNFSCNYFGKLFYNLRDITIKIYFIFGDT